MILYGNDLKYVKLGSHMSPFYAAAPFTQPVIICSKLTIETLEQKCEICSKSTITLNMFHTFFSKVSIINFEQVNAGWDIPTENIRKTLEGIRE